MQCLLIPPDRVDDFFATGGLYTLTGQQAVDEALSEAFFLRRARSGCHDP